MFLAQTVVLGMVYPLLYGSSFLGYGGHFRVTDSWVNISILITVWNAVAQVRIPVEAIPHYFYNNNNIRLNVFTTS